MGSFFLLKVKIRQSGRLYHSKSDGGGCKVDVKLKKQPFLTHFSLPLLGLQGSIIQKEFIRHLPDLRQPAWKDPVNDRRLTIKILPVVCFQLLRHRSSAASTESYHNGLWPDRYDKAPADESFAIAYRQYLTAEPEAGKGTSFCNWSGQEKDTVAVPWCGLHLTTGTLAPYGISGLAVTMLSGLYLSTKKTAGRWSPTCRITVTVMPGRS